MHEKKTTNKVTEDGEYMPVFDRWEASSGDFVVEPPKSKTLNSDTLAAIKERDEMAQHPEKYRRYSSFADFMQEEAADV